MKRTMKTLRSGKNDPINFYYQYVPADPPHKKVKVIKKNQTLAGTYEHTFVKSDDGVVYKTYLIKTEAEGNITVKGCTGLSDLDGLTRGTYVELTYLGLGKKKGKRSAPFLWKVDVEDTGNAPETDETDESIAENADADVEASEEAADTEENADEVF